MPVPFTDDHFKDKIPYYYMQWQDLQDRSKPNYYDPISGTYFRNDENILENGMNGRVIHMLSKKYDIARDWGNSCQIYFADHWKNSIIFRFFSIPIIYDTRKKFPIFDGYRETMRLYFTQEGLYFETCKGMSEFHYSLKIKERMYKYNYMPLYQESIHVYETEKQYEEDIENKFVSLFPDLFWIMGDSFYQEPLFYNRSCSRIHCMLEKSITITHAFLKYKNMISNNKYASIRGMNISDKIINVFRDIGRYDSLCEQDVWYTKIAVLEQKENNCRIHYLKKLPDIFGDNIIHEYAMDCFDVKGKETSFIHLLNGQWIKSKQRFYKYDSEVYMPDLLLVDQKTVQLEENLLKDTFLKKFLLSKVHPYVRLRYIFAAKRNCFWEQAVKCGFQDWVYNQLEPRKHDFNPKFIRCKDFTEYFTIKEWKENKDKIKIDNMEPLYSLKIAGFTISAAYELVHGYYDSMYGAYVFMEAYTETGYAENFVKLMNTLVKRKGNVRIDIKEYDDYLRMRKELPKQALYDYPIVISRKKIHRYHQRIVNVINCLHLEKQKKILEKYEKSYRRFMENPDRHGLQYKYENEKFSVFPAPSINSLLEEGRYLHHCVGSYYKQVGSGYTTIYFLRKETDIDKPFFTIEVKVNTVVQVYTFYDQPIKRDTPEYEFVVEWMCKYKLKNGFWAE